MARILLVEDDDAVRGVLAEMMIRSGHTVTKARDGVEGLALFEPAAFDLVITDMMMPRQGGREVLRALRKREPQVKVLAMSGGDRAGPTDVLSVARLEGAAGVLAKPFTAHVLLSAIREVLGNDTADGIEEAKQGAAV